MHYAYVRQLTVCVLIFALEDSTAAICCVLIQQIGRPQTGVECFKNYVLLARSVLVIHSNFSCGARMVMTCKNGLLKLSPDGNYTHMGMRIIQIRV